METDAKQPRTFVDSAGRRWTLRVDVGKAQQVREQLHIDLLKSDTERTILELADNPIDLCGVLWLLVKQQAAAAGVDNQAFWEGMTDDAVEAATFAFLEALIDFFPRRRQDALRRIVAKMRDVGEKQLAHVEAAIETGQVDARIERGLAKWKADINEELTRGLDENPSTAGA